MQPQFFVLDIFPGRSGGSEWKCPDHKLPRDVNLSYSNGTILKKEDWHVLEITFNTLQFTVGEPWTIVAGKLISVVENLELPVLDFGPIQVAMQGKNYLSAIGKIMARQASAQTSAKESNTQDTQLEDQPVDAVLSQAVQNNISDSFTLNKRQLLKV